MFKDRKDLVAFLAGLSVVLFTLWIVYLMIFPFFAPLLLAYVTAVTLAPWYDALVIKLRRPYLAAPVLCLALLLVLFLPMAGTVAWGISDLRDFLDKHSTDELMNWGLALVQKVREMDSVKWLMETFHLNPDTMLARLRAWFPTAIAPVSKSLGGLLVSVPDFILGTFIYFITLVFALAERDSLHQLWRRVSPFPKSAEHVINKEFASACKGVVVGTILSAFAQATLFAVGLAILTAFSSTEPGAWIVILAIASLLVATIPFLGAAIVWVPTAVVLILMGDLVAGLGLIVIGVTMISTVDNLVKVLALKDAGNLHPLWAFLTVIGGLKAFGLIGVLIGPIFGALVFTILRLFHSHVEGEPDRAIVVEGS